MKTKILSLLLFTLSLSIFANDNNFYDYSAKDIDGQEVSMSAYKGKVVLVVNVASKCGFTKQYEGLEKLYKAYKDKGLVILGFPCNQFGSQEKGTESEIKSFCSLTYGVTFPMFSKIDVNGEKAHPIYIYLKKSLEGTIIDDIKWNFTKFLIDRNGKPFKRYSSLVKPEEIEKEIADLLK